MRIRRLVMVVALLLVAAGGTLVFQSGLHRSYLEKLRSLVTAKKYNKKETSIQPLIKNNILCRLNYLEIDTSSISVRTPVYGDSIIEIHAVAPRGKPVEWVLWYLSSAAEETGYEIDDCNCPSDGRECKIRFVSTKSNEPTFVLAIKWSSRYYSKAAKMAVIITDFGFAADRTTIEYLSFQDPLTVALAPSRKLASWTAQISNEYKKEIIILLPMEGTDRIPAAYRSSMIMVHYPETKLRSIIENAVESIPHFAGFCNLSGSRVLGDSRVTDILFFEMKKRHGYFVEEKVAGKTLVAAFSRKYDVSFAPIQYRADTTLNVPELQEFLRRSALEAQRRGAIIISSKATQSFIRALKNEVPSLKENGIRLSYVSDLLSGTRDEENAKK